MDSPLAEDNLNMSFLIPVPEQHARASVWRFPHLPSIQTYLFL